LYASFSVDGPLSSCGHVVTVENCTDRGDRLADADGDR